MATEIKIWEIEDQKITPVQDTPLAAARLEDDLETWITQMPEILGDDLLIIARQWDIPEVGRLDLLCIDSSAKLVVVELKRDRSSRDAVAQALDYASWLNDAGAKEILDHAAGYLKADLSAVFQKHFGDEMPDTVPQNHRVIIVAARVDNSAERIVNYLRERYNIDLNVLLFKYAKLAGGQEVLIRTVLLPEPPVREGSQPTDDDLVALAEERNIAGLVEACRALKEVWDERARRTYGGSFRYKARGVGIVCGVNIAGALAQAPPGKLDVWVRAAVLSQATEVPEETIRQELRGTYSVAVEGKDACVIRLSTRDEAEHLVTQLKKWAEEGAAKLAA